MMTRLSKLVAGTNSIRSFSLLAGLAIVCALGTPGGARGGNTMTINMGTVINSMASFPNGDQSSSPYTIATIIDGALQGNAGVYLTMSCPGLGFAGSGNYEHVNNGAGLGNPAWLFNLTSTAGLTQSAFTLISKTGHSGFTTPTITIDSTSDLQADAQAEFYNLGFSFAEGTMSTDGPDGGVEFGNGDSIQYFIEGLTTASFQAAVTTSGGHTLDTNYSAAKIDDAMGGPWVAGGGITTVTVPEPTTLTLLTGFVGLGLVGLVWRRRKSVA